MRRFPRRRPIVLMGAWSLARLPVLLDSQLLMLMLLQAYDLSPQEKNMTDFH